MPGVVLDGLYYYYYYYHHCYKLFATSYVEVTAVKKIRKEIIIKKQTTHLDQYEEQCNRYATQSSTLHNNRVRTMDLIPPVFKANYIAEANVFVFIFFFKCVSGVHFSNV